jgi:type I restriction enzyme S subunit
VNIVDSISKTYKFVNSSAVLINTSDILEGKVLNHKKESIENIAGQFKKEFQMNDILYSEIRPINKRFAFIDFDSKDYVASTKIMILRKKNDTVDNDFLYQFLKSEETIKKLQSIAESRSGTFPQITFSELSNLEIKLPPINIQKKIKSILLNIDKKIDINSKTNKSIEDLSQTLYKRWFVDFEFPNEKGEPYKSSGGEMVNSELGLIPKGWEVRNVSDLFVFIGGSQPPKEEHKYDYRPGYVRFIQNRDFKEDPKHITFIKDSKKNKMANKLDILIDKYGEVGQIRFGIEGAYNVALAKLEPHLKSDLELLRGYFSQREIREYLSNSSIASTRGSLNSTTFTGLKIAYPSKLLIKHFSEFNQYLLLSILNKKSENKKLAELRDLLLPKLMSGEIEVPLEE